MKKRILVVDESRLMCYGLKKALCRELIEVDTAYTVSEAVMNYRSNKYELCLFDICPPDEKGFRLMALIRDSWPGIRIILMTATDISLYDDENEIIHKAKSNGGSHLLCKPFELKMLQEVILTVLGEESVDSWFADEFFICSRRRKKRKRVSKTIHFSMQVINDGKIKRTNYSAESVNISDDGITLRTSGCMLKPSEIISFDGELGGKAGVVIWSSELEGRGCKAGIRFA